MKQVTWSGVKWTSVDDSKLLVGVYQYGLGNWENIKDDPTIGLSKKVQHYMCLSKLTVYVKLIENLFYSEAYDLFCYVYNM